MSAAFILISSKVGDLIGRKRAYVLGLLGYAIGALAMTLAQNLTAIIIFWAILGGLGASLLLPAMQSLIHGNFEGAARRGPTRWSGLGRDRRRRRAAARRLRHHLPVVARRLPARGSVIIGVVLSGSGSSATSRTPAPAQVDFVGAVLSVVGMGGLVLGILVWQEGGEAVGLLIASARSALALLAWWLVRRKRERQARPCSTRTCSRPRTSGSASPGSCSSRSRSAAR